MQKLQVPQLQLSHVVGGVAIVLDGDCPTERAARSDEPVELTLTLHTHARPAPLRPAGEPRVEVDSWAAFVEGDTFVLCIKSALADPLEVMRVELPRRGLEGQLYFRRDVEPRPFLYPADQLLIVHALGVGGGFLAHGAAIVGRDGAFLVSGPSGAGKTTMSHATSALGARILSDERTIVRRRPDGCWVLGGTPWPGEGGYAENRSVPLRGLMLIEQADRNELEPLSPARALARLYRCHFPPAWDVEAMQQTLDNMERLVREVPAFRYRNVKGPDAARLLLDRLGGPP
jgi:hypothetical protein